MTRCIHILTLILLFSSIKGHNPRWVHMDKVLINKITSLDKNNPKEVEAFFKSRTVENSPLHTTEDLGFGWKIWNSAVGGGYVSIHVKFIYYNDSIVSYFMEPQLPEERSLKQRYKKWYTPFFPQVGNEVLTLKYNPNGVLRPIQQYDYSLSLKTVPDSLLEYMSPESGLLYGYRGNSGYYFQNRQAFINIKKYLTTDNVILLMYSINPVSRLTAIEYYLNHKQDFPDTEKIDNWVETIFKKFPKTNTIRGCIMGPVDTRELVNNMRNAQD